MTRLRLTLLVVAGAALACFAAQASDGGPPRCLYATAVGTERLAVEPCGPDSLGVGANGNIRAVMRYFGLPQETVQFKSCPGGRFSAEESNGTAAYVVTYPSDARSDFLAPVVHELAHVVQMKQAGGLLKLRAAADSRRIELGADFLAGLAFHAVLGQLKQGDFETNLRLIGSYTGGGNDHGCPEDRTQAFRVGATRAAPYPNLTYLQALEYFDGNHYAQIICWKD